MMNVSAEDGRLLRLLAEIQGPIDMCFIDADKEGYSDYLAKRDESYDAALVS